MGDVGRTALPTATGGSIKLSVVFPKLSTGTVGGSFLMGVRPALVSSIFMVGVLVIGDGISTGREMVKQMMEQ